MRIGALRAVAAAVAGMALSFAGAAQEPSAADFALSLQKKYDTIRDFSADFVQTYRGGVLNRQMKATGKVLVKKPGRMRWEYRTPEERLFVSDGVKGYAYTPQDKQVIVTTVAPEDQASTPELFLAGKGNISRDFTVTFTEPPAGQPANSRALKLVPRKAQPEYDWLILSVDPGTLALRGLVTGDAQGGTSSFTFNNLKENVGLTDKPFVFAPPRGVEIVTDSSRR